MTGRRSYDERAELGLRNSSLGEKRRTDGMARLMARAGKGLMFKLPHHAVKKEDGETTDEEDNESDDEKEEDKPFEPLCVWVSPHNGGEALGLPPSV